MKKFVSKIVVAATLAMTLMVSSVAFAAGTSVSVKAGAAPKAGEQVQFSVSFNSSEKIGGVQANVKASSNLEFVKAEANTAWIGAKKEVGFALAGDKNAAVNDVTVTYTYKVKADAKAGDEVKFEISNVILSNDTGSDALEATIVNSSAAVKVADATVAPTTKPTDKPQSTNKPAAGNDKKDDVPKTGDTTTPVWPFVAVLAVCAGVAVVALKKKSLQK